MNKTRTRIDGGISQRGDRMIVRASIGSNRSQRFQAPEESFSLDTPASVLQATLLRQKMKLRDRQEKAGGPVEHGLVSGDIVKYLGVKKEDGTFLQVGVVSLSKQLWQERYVQLAWWRERFGRRRRADIKPHELQTALNGLRRTPREHEIARYGSADKVPAELLVPTASTKNKYLQAFSALWTKLDGKTAVNPFREFGRFEEEDGEPRDQPYELIDLMLANLRARGRGKTPSRTRAFLNVEAYAPLTRAQLVKMPRAWMFWDAGEHGEILAPARKKGKGVQLIRKPLTADGLAAFRLFDAANCWGHRPSKSSIRRTFLAARDKAIAQLSVERPDLDLSRAHLMKPYDLRHSFATKAYQTIGDLNVVAELLSQKDLRTTRRYAQSALPTILANAGQKIAAAFAERPKMTVVPTTASAPVQTPQKRRAGKRGG